MSDFSERLTKSIQKRSSYLVAGLDPVLDNLPTVFLDEAGKSSSDNADAIYSALVSFYEFALDQLKDDVAAVKPNSAFFEQYGPAGMRALQSVCMMASNLNLPVIMDAKRGDIGSTAQAYSNAFLSGARAFGKTVQAFHADALTVNPYLGFDTLEPYIEDCRTHGKGIFVLVRTSNPQSGDLQEQKLADGSTISEHIARWLDKNSARLSGSGSFSGLGAVVGAPYPAAARALRELMPDNFFLIPGFGSQGGSAADATAGFGKGGGGAVVNASRALLGSFSRKEISRTEAAMELKDRVRSFNSDLNSAVTALSSVVIAQNNP